MEPEPLEIAETLRALWEQSEALDLAVRQLGEHSPGLVRAARRAAERHVGGQPLELYELLEAVGAAAALARCVSSAAAGVGDAARELPLRLAPEAPTPLAVRAIEELGRRLTAAPAQPSG